MDATAYTSQGPDYTLIVRPPGWLSQYLLLIPAALLFTLAYYAIPPFPLRPDSVIFDVLNWAAGTAFLAAAFQGARRTVIFSSTAHHFTIATLGPLRQSTRQFPPNSLQAAMVANSQTRVMGQPLPQLQLHFAGQNTPIQLFTGRKRADLKHIAGLLTESLNPTQKSFSPAQFMEVRLAPIHATTFRNICGIATAIGLAAFFAQPLVGTPVASLIMFTAVFSAVLTFSFILRRANCPQCHAPLKRDNLSPQGHFQYTCPHCRILWQSPIRAGGRRS